MDQDGKRPGKNGGTIKPYQKGSERARACGRLGGVACGVANKERRLVADIVAKYLAKEHDIEIYDVKRGAMVTQRFSTEDLFERTINTVMVRGDAASASMIKTLAEINEGKNVNLTGSVLTGELSPEERAIRIAELELKRKKK